MSHTGVWGTGSRRHAARKGGASTAGRATRRADANQSQPGSAAREPLDSALVRSVRCPTCRRQTPWEGNPHRPFCSDRCRVLDLAAWADERYRIPGEPVPSEPDTPDVPGGRPPGRER